MGNLHTSLSESELYRYFSKYAQIEQLQILRNKKGANIRAGLLSVATKADAM